MYRKTFQRVRTMQIFKTRKTFFTITKLSCFQKTKNMWIFRVVHISLTWNNSSPIFQSKMCFLSSAAWRTMSKLQQRWLHFQGVAKKCTDLKGSYLIQNWFNFNDLKYKVKQIVIRAYLCTSFPKITTILENHKGNYVFNVSEHFVKGFFCDTCNRMKNFALSAAIFSESLQYSRYFI